MRKKSVKRALMAVVVGTMWIGLGGGCLEVFGRSVLASAGEAVGLQLSENLPFGNLFGGNGG